MGLEFYQKSYDGLNTQDSCVRSEDERVPAPLLSFARGRPLQMIICKRPAEVRFVHAVTAGGSVKFLPVV